MQIVFACGSGGPGYQWNDANAEKGIGGSEECVILLARELAKLGHEVIVYNNCAGKTGKHNGVEYRSYAFYDKMPKTDLLVAWRNWGLLVGAQATQKWLWCHDIPVGCHCPSQEEIDRPDSALNYIDKFVLLNNYHRELYHHIPSNKVFVCPIGVDQTTFDIDPPARIQGRVLYFSHPGRGLDRLREVWPQVREAVPNATLAAFWWEPDQFREPNEALGILPMRSLGYKEVAVECLRADVFGYPSVFAPEISPATTIKAQMGGAIPVVVMQGGMVDTVKYGRWTDQEHFASELIDVLRMTGTCDDPRLKQAENAARQDMMTWARIWYSWESVARKWEARFYGIQ